MKIAVPLSDTEFYKKAKICKEIGADIVELRVDTFKDKSVENVKNLIEYAHSIGLETILTVRSEKEGGSYVENKEEIFLQCAPLSDYTDVELSSGYLVHKVKPIAKKLIISYHNFELTPSEWILREILREAKRVGAHIVKIAVMARSYEDVARLLCVGKEEPIDKILIAMGNYGKVSRLCGYIFGSVITYSYIGESVAPGQLPLEEMVKLRKMFYE